MTDITEFLFPAPAPRTVGGIVRWWESRRLKYNLMVGAAGLTSTAVVAILTFLPPDAHGMQGPIGEFLPIAVVFGVAANICYTLGPMVELMLEKLWGRRALPTGPTLFRMGLTFSVGLALLPTLIAGFDWAFRILHSLF
ncbi:MAG: hypothetical protein WEE89_09255 [Gemmatimonadota bacterium]